MAHAVLTNDCIFLQDSEPLSGGERRRGAWRYSLAPRLRADAGGRGGCRRARAKSGAAGPRLWPVHELTRSHSADSKPPAPEHAQTTGGNCGLRQLTTVLDAGDAAARAAGTAVWSCRRLPFRLRDGGACFR